MLLFVDVLAQILPNILVKMTQWNRMTAQRDAGVSSYTAETKQAFVLQKHARLSKDEGLFLKTDNFQILQSQIKRCESNNTKFISPRYATSPWCLVVNVWSLSLKKKNYWVNKTKVLALRRLRWSTRASAISGASMIGLISSAQDNSTNYDSTRRAMEWHRNKTQDGK